MKWTTQKPKNTETSACPIDNIQGEWSSDPIMEGAP